MKFTTIFATLIALVLIVPAVANAEIIIDNYTAGTTLRQEGAGTTTQDTVDGSILGGQRRDSLTVTPQGNNDEFFGTVGFNGALDVAQGSQDRIFGSATYNSFGTIDFTEMGANDSFLLRFVSSDINAPLANVVSVTATSGINSSTQSVTVPANAGLPADILLSFSSFAGVDFTAIDSVSVNYDFAQNPGRDLEVGLFSATASVPEPATGLLAGLVTLGLIGRRRR